MSIQTLVQVFDETRRIAVAGSAVAPGDFRLKKLIPLLEQAGAKAPIFAKVAQSAQAVVNSTEATASTALLELTTLVNAILYTQGETGIAGELKPIQTANTAAQATQASARLLKPLLEAFSTTGSGRFELMSEAFDRGLFNDIRLIQPALKAIDDPNPEIGRFICKDVLPTYGKAVFADIQRTLDIKGKSAGHLNRLRLLHKIDPQLARPLVIAALADGSKEIKVVAVECLGISQEDIPLLIEHAKSKAKEVRSAALNALTASANTSPEALAAIKKAIDGADLILIANALRQCTLAPIVDHLLDAAQTQFATLLKEKDVKNQGLHIERMRILLACLSKWPDPRAEAVVSKCFEEEKALAKIKSTPSGTDLYELSAAFMAQGSQKLQSQLAKAHAQLKGPTAEHAFLAARQVAAPGAFYAEFAPVLKTLAAGKKKTPDHEKSELLVKVLTYDESHNYNMFIGHFHYAAVLGQPLKPLDPKWLDAAVEIGIDDLVIHLARPDHAPTLKFLSTRVAAHEDISDATDLVQAMVKLKHPEAVDSILAMLKKLAQSPTAHHYSRWYTHVIPDLPKSAAPKFEQLLTTLPEKMVDILLGSVQELKNKPE
jgi:hypothetical protein